MRALLRMKWRALIAAAVVSGCVLAAAIAWLIILDMRGGPPSGRTAPRLLCMTNIRLLGSALQMYSEEWNGHLPIWNQGGDEDSWVRAVRPYYGGGLEKILRCPSDTRSFGVTSYQFPEAASGLDIRHLSDPGKKIILTEKRAFHEGRRWAYFADGHWASVPEKRAPKRR